MTGKPEYQPTDSRDSRAKSRLRILHTVSSLKVGGMEHFVLRIAEAQQRLGHQVSILALQDGPLHEEAVRLGLRVYVLGGAHKLPRALKGALTLARLRPDIVNAHNQTSLHYAILGKKFGKARVVMTNHGQGMGSARTPGAEEWRLTDAIVTVSQAVAQRMDQDLLADKIVTIYNGVTITPARRPRQEVRAELGLAEDRVVGTIVARMDHLKGHDTLLHALAFLQQQGVPATVLIAGDGAERGAREELARTLQLGPEVVRFLGFRTDVSDLLGASDFFVLPSLTEGLPLSVLEAMTHHLPTVATPVGGIPELVMDGQHGLLVPVNDPIALAEAMASLVRSPDLRRALGEAAYQRVREEFSFEQMTCNYDELYYRLCTR